LGFLKVKWWNPTVENATKLSENIKIESRWIVEADANKMCEEMAKCIKRSVKEILGVSKGGSDRVEGAWWREEVKEKVKVKQEKYKVLMDSRTDEEKEANKVQYRMTKREAKKAVAVVKTNAYE